MLLAMGPVQSLTLIAAAAPEKVLRRRSALWVHDPCCGGFRQNVVWGGCGLARDARPCPWQRYAVTSALSR